MLYSPRLYLSDRWIIFPAVISIVLLVIMWWYLIIHIHPTTDQLFLHYTVVFGVDLVGSWWKLYYVPVAGTAIFFINYGFSHFMYRPQKFLARLLAMFTILIEIFLIVAAWLLVALNS